MKVTRKVHNELSAIRKEKAQKELEEQANFIVRKKTGNRVSKKIYGWAKTEEEAHRIAANLNELNPGYVFTIECKKGRE